jgi:hypothetical protein
VTTGTNTGGSSCAAALGQLCVDGGHLGRAGIFESYAQQFEAIWTESRPVAGGVVPVAGGS